MMSAGRVQAAAVAISDEDVKAVLAEVLALDPATSGSIQPDTPLFGALPELDSMSVAGLLTEFEDRFGIIVDDEDVDAEVFATLASLAGMLRAKLR